jgi:hypothetical protein
MDEEMNDGAMTGRGGFVSDRETAINSKRYKSKLRIRGVSQGT